MHRKVDAIVIDHYFMSKRLDLLAGTRYCDYDTTNIPLSLYSLGSSFLPLMLNDNDALESA